jgi:outer membrane protein OmpA-like peptidoglycan-associated protein
MNRWHGGMGMTRSAWIWFLGILAFCFGLWMCLNLHLEGLLPKAAAAAVVSNAGPASVSLTRMQNSIVVSGLVKSKDEHEQVVAAVRSAAGPSVSVVDRLLESSEVSALAGRFVPLASRFVPFGQSLDLGANRLRFVARTPDAAAKSSLESDVVRAAQGLTVDAQVSVEESKTEVLQKEVDDILKGTVIEFQTASAVIRPGSFKVLDSIAAKLKAYPEVRVKIDGHTDALGAAAANVRLSQSRADSVKNALVQRGVAAPRIESTGYGSARPLVPETSAENRAKNRRIELVIVKP